MKLADAARQALQGTNTAEAFETDHETGVRPDALPPATDYETRATKDDHELADKLRCAGAKEQFLGAVCLFDMGKKPQWTYFDAVQAACKWWGCENSDDITALQWVLCAAHVDVVKQFSTHQYEQTDGSKRGQNDSLNGDHFRDQ
ncbi:MAG: hypothetical protein QF680_03280 [Acidobacteriota bacterium]|jgi:hypothetical protein|nr:hypothetical protein [Acidobacteriota bacterium]